jgi:cytochrome b pre-mRNA-processing protein 3
MLNLFKKTPDPEAVHAVYSAIVAQSRQPVFYAEWGVADTVTGRFDMICVHMALVFRRLNRQGKVATEFAQALFDLFFKDMDRNLREMGAGDLSVPKKIRNMGNLFYGLMTNLNEAMERNDRAGAEEVLKRNVFGNAEGGQVAKLADYLEAKFAQLEAQPVEAVVAGRLEMGEAA